MLQSFALAAVVFTDQASVGVIYLLAAVQGVLTAFDNPSRRSFVVDMVPHEDLNNAVSLNSALMTGSRIFGPAAAGALVVTVGFAWCFLLDGISYLAVLWSLWRMRPAELHSTARAPRAKGQVREGLRYIRDHRTLFVPLVMMAIIGTLAFNFSVTIPLLVKGPLGGSNVTFTIMFSTLSLGSLLGALGTARRKVVTSRQLAVAATCFGLTMFALAAAPALPFAFVAAIALGIASIAFMTSSTAIVQLEAGPLYRGRVLAIQSMVFLGSTPIGGPVVGFISDRFGPRIGLVVGGVACVLAAAYGARALGLHRRPDASGGLGEPEPVPKDMAALAD
jgi:MFS family permease